MRRSHSRSRVMSAVTIEPSAASAKAARDLNGVPPHCACILELEALLSFTTLVRTQRLPQAHFKFVSYLGIFCVSLTAKCQGLVFPFPARPPLCPCWIVARPPKPPPAMSQQCHASQSVAAVMFFCLWLVAHPVRALTRLGDTTYFLPSQKGPLVLAIGWSTRAEHYPSLLVLLSSAYLLAVTVQLVTSPLPHCGAGCLGQQSLGSDSVWRPARIVPHNIPYGTLHCFYR